MHWDLRLEIDGVLASWAIPRGPTLDPAEKRLAVRTEDHPLEYAAFEGTIPDGNYGAGAMIVWDVGSYRTVDGMAAAEGLVSGKLDLELRGQKLAGRFALVKTREEAEWLLLRKGPPPADARPVTETARQSVFSGLAVDEIAEGPSDLGRWLRRRVGRAKAPPLARPALDWKPMLATSHTRAFSDPAWVYELKYDGVRTLLRRDGDTILLRARSGRDVTEIYPEVVEAAAHLPIDDLAIDGEIVALDETGRSRFERIQQRFTQTDVRRVARIRAAIPVVFYAFDLPAAAGRDLRGQRLDWRKATLERIVPRTGVIRFTDHVVEAGEALFERVREHELEGMIAKRADSVYEDGRRSARWRKIKRPVHAHLAIVGYTAGRGGAGGERGIASLLVAGWDGEELRYLGNVGAGLRGGEIDSIREHLVRTSVDEPPFVAGPAPPADSRYAVPELVCEVRFTEVTNAGSLRQPVFLGLRADVPVAACRAPVAGESVSDPTPTPLPPTPPPTAPPATPDITRPEKVFWPGDGYTKGDLLAYYEAIWPWLEPYLADRPVVLTRYPDGIEGKSFFQKNAPDFTPEWVGRQMIDETDYFLCNDLETLLYVVNSGAIPLHVWSARGRSLEAPDWLILDLDPKSAPFAHVVDVARHTHRLLDDLGAPHYVKTSGQDGLHIFLPLGGDLDHEDAKRLGEVLARTVVAELPEIATVTRPVAGRADKVYLDYLQNGRGKLIASIFSVRPRPGAPVSMPLSWSQVTRRLNPGRFTIKTAPGLLSRRGDAFRDVLTTHIDPDGLLTALAERLAESDPEG